MTHDSNSETMQAYLNMLLSGVPTAQDEDELEAQDVADHSAVAECETEQSQTDAQKEKTQASALASEKMASLERSNKGASLSHSSIQESVPVLSESSKTNVPSASTSGTGSRVASDYAKQKQMQQLAQKTGSGRPIVPELEDTDELREEQRARLQKLLGQQSLKVQTQPVAQPKTTAPPKTKEAPSHQKRAPKPRLPKQEAPAALAPKEKELAPEIAPHIQPSIQTNTDSDLSGSFHCDAAQRADWHDNGRPYWGQDRFDALLFDVAGLTLAVPLVALGQIVRFENEEITPIFGQSDWFMGMLESNVGRLRVVNTSLFVMPEKYDETFKDKAEYAISLDGVQWALAVDRVNQPISLDPAEIKWRTERSKRPWLAGTVKSQMCALLDVPRMAQLLNKSDKALSVSN